MISQLSNSFNWYPALFQNSPQSQTNSNMSAFDATSIDNYVSQNSIEQTLNLENQNTNNTSTYDLLNNISNDSQLYGISTIDQYSQINALQSSIPAVATYNQALQSYQSTNMYTLASSYDKSI